MGMPAGGCASSVAVVGTPTADAALLLVVSTRLMAAAAASCSSGRQLGSSESGAQRGRHAVHALQQQPGLHSAGAGCCRDGVAGLVATGLFQYAFMVAARMLGLHGRAWHGGACAVRSGERCSKGGGQQDSNASAAPDFSSIQIP